MRLLIVIPVFNERRYVDLVLAKVLRIVRDSDVSMDVLMVDDGSTDGTAELLAARHDVKLLRHAGNSGYGQSLIDGFAYAKDHGYDWVITMDCDEQHEPERIPRFIQEMRGGRWDLISGSRYLEPGPGDDLPPVERRRINAELTDLVNRTLGMHLTDTFCGYKAHRVSAMRRLRLDVAGYAFPMQLWPQVAAAGLRVTEIPVRLIYNDPTRHFGGRLDDADNRLRHYLQVFHDELRRTRPAESVADEEVCCCAK